VQLSEAWEPLGPVDKLGNFGPELSLGAHLRKTLTSQDPIAVVKFTHSGAQAPDWSPDGSPETRRDLYQKFSKFIREATDDLARQGYESTLEGVFWHTGENDTYFTPYQRNYAEGMRRLIAEVRLNFKNQSLRWFISEQHPAAIWKSVAEINGALRTLAALGVQTLVLTNAAGSLDPALPPGGLMLISDHLNLPQLSPLWEERDDRRFVDMTDAYDPALRARARAAASRVGVELHEGVYAWMIGPQFETPAEISMLRTLGADAVGMSTVPETIVARHAGLHVLGLSMVTNMAAGLGVEKLSHAQTLRQAQAASERACAALAAIVQYLPTKNASS
jgi:inosine/guanosine/xanthosine phosphorylase family protein